MAPSGPLSQGLENLARWAQRQPIAVDNEQQAILVGLVHELHRYAWAVETLECEVRGLQAAVTLLAQGQAIDLAEYLRHQQECLQRRPNR